MNGLNQPTNFNPIWFETATDVTCSECGSEYFKKVLRIKKISILTQTLNPLPNTMNSLKPLKDIIQPVSITICAKCGKELDIE